MNNMIYIFRHGETIYNMENRYLGQTDISLCDKGIENYTQLAKVLGLMQWNAIFCSDYIRAIQSAKIVSNHIGVSCRVLPELRERNLGILDGKLKSDKYYSDYKEKLQNINFTPQDGENPSICIERFSIAMNEIRKIKGGNILVISHGGIVSLYLRYVLGITCSNIFLNNGFCHILEDIDGVGMSVVNLNYNPKRGDFL